MISIKDYIGKHFIDKRLHLKCNCIVTLDIKGLCTGYNVSGNEIILEIYSNNKTIPIGLNTPNLEIEIL